MGAATAAERELAASRTGRGGARRVDASGAVLAAALVTAVGSCGVTEKRPAYELFLMVDYDRDEGERRLACIFLGPTLCVFERTPEDITELSHLAKFLDGTEIWVIDDSDKVEWATTLQPEVYEELARAVAMVDWAAVDACFCEELRREGFVVGERQWGTIVIRLRDAAGKFRTYSTGRNYIALLDELVRKVNAVLPPDYRIDWRRPE